MRDLHYYALLFLMIVLGFRPLHLPAFFRSLRSYLVTFQFQPEPHLSSRIHLFLLSILKDISCQLIPSADHSGFEFRVDLFLDLLLLEVYRTQYVLLLAHKWLFQHTSITYISSQITFFFLSFFFRLYPPPGISFPSQLHSLSHKCPYLPLILRNPLLITQLYVK